MAEFRLITNQSIRSALALDIRSRKRLVQAAYRDLSRDHAVYKQYIPSAFEVALGVLKVHRRRLRSGKPTRGPFVKRLMLKAENQSYHLDRESGLLDLPIRAGERVRIQLPISNLHRSFLSDRSWGLGSLTLVPGKVVITIRKTLPHPFTPTSAIALDTNEDSLDAVLASEEDSVPTSVPLGGIRRIQQTHYRRRRKLAAKKVRDRRVMRRLLNREGRREGNRVRQRLHFVSKRVVRFAEKASAAIVLGFQPGALRHDVVSPLYDLSALPTGARDEPSGVECVAVVAR